MLFKARFQLTNKTRLATMSAGISAIRVPATGTHSATVIWLHGLGDTGKGWSFLAKYVDIPVRPSERFCWLISLACKSSSSECEKILMSSGSFPTHLPSLLRLTVDSACRDGSISLPLET